MNEVERKAKTINAFRQLDPKSTGGLYLTDVAERVALSDQAFMRRYNLSSRLLSLVGVERPTDHLGFRYLPRLYPVTAQLERQGVIDSEWEMPEDGEPKYPRRRIYRYLGITGLDR